VEKNHVVRILIPASKRGEVFDETFADSMACYCANCEYTVEVSCRTLGTANHSENNIFIISMIADRELPKFRGMSQEKKHVRKSFENA
jgi:hypothetical protein